MITELFEEFDSDVICVQDLNLMFQGSLITHIARNSDGQVAFWSGDPENAKYAEELLLDNATAKLYLQEIEDEL